LNWHTNIFTIKTHTKIKSRDPLSEAIATAAVLLYGERERERERERTKKERHGQGGEGLQEAAADMRRVMARARGCWRVSGALAWDVGLMFFFVFLSWVSFSFVFCSTSSPHGNQVDGLPRVVQSFDMYTKIIFTCNLLLKMIGLQNI